MFNSFCSLRLCSWSKMWPIGGFIGTGTLFQPRRCIDSVAYPCYMQCFVAWSARVILYYRLVLPIQVFLVFWFDVRILDVLPLLQSLYHFRRVLSRAELNLFGNLIWLNESMVICFSNFVTCSKWLTLLQREVKWADSLTQLHMEQSSQVSHVCS